MLSVSIGGFRLYQILFFFFIYSLLGWMMETTLVSIQQRRFVNRGFLVGPCCPIYGVGMVLFLLALTPWAAYPLALFLGGALVATLLEYGTSWAMEKLFAARWWDYSHFRLNLNGRVCLPISLCWGGLAVLFIRFLHPPIGRLIDSIPPVVGRWVLGGLSLLFVVDLVYSVATATRFSARLRRLSQLREELHRRLEQSGLFERAEILRAKFAAGSFGELKSALQERLDTADHAARLAELRQALGSLSQRYNQQQKVRPGEHRILRAYPRLQLRRPGRIIEELRERIEQKRKTGPHGRQANTERAGKK